MRDTMERVNIKKTGQVKVYQPGSQHVVGDGFTCGICFQAMTWIVS